MQLCMYVTTIVKRLLGALPKHIIKHALSMVAVIDLTKQGDLTPSGIVHTNMPR